MGETYDQMGYSNVEPPLYPGPIELNYRRPSRTGSTHLWMNFENAKKLSKLELSSEEKNQRIKILETELDSVQQATDIFILWKIFFCGQRHFGVGVSMLAWCYSGISSIPVSALFYGNSRTKNKNKKFFRTEIEPTPVAVRNPNLGSRRWN